MLLPLPLDPLSVFKTTWILQVAFFFVPFTFAVIVALPTFTAFTTPFFDTLATLFLLLFHWIFFCVVFLGLKEAFSFKLFPFCNLYVEWFSVIFFNLTVFFRAKLTGVPVGKISMITIDIRNNAIGFFLFFMNYSPF